SLSDPPLYLLLLPSFPTRRSSDLTFVCFINCFRLISWFRLFFVTAIVLALVSIVIILTVSGIIAVLAVFRTVVFLAVIILTAIRSEEHTSELQSRFDLVCRLLLEK